MNNVFIRLKQPSTWAGLLSIACSLLVSKGQLDAATTTAVVNALGLVLVDA